MKFITLYAKREFLAENLEALIGASKPDPRFKLLDRLPREFAFCLEEIGKGAHAPLSGPSSRE